MSLGWKAVVGRCSSKWVFSKISPEDLQGQTPCNFIKKEIPTQVWSCKYFEIFKKTFFIEHLQWLLLWFL